MKVKIERTMHRTRWYVDYILDPYVFNPYLYINRYGVLSVVPMGHQAIALMRVI